MPLPANKVNHEDGAFASHITFKSGMGLLLPNHTPFTSGATLGVSVLATGLSMFRPESLSLPLSSSSSSTPPSGRFPILIYCGSTSLGTLAIQFAKLAGLTVLTTCSPKHF